MMVPVVFLVLPVTVLFALFPGFFGFSFAELSGATYDRSTGDDDRHPGTTRESEDDAGVAHGRRRPVAALSGLRCDLDAGHERRRDRGDVPGWVLVTIMTAGLVTALWLVADDKLKQLFSDALDGVVGNAP